MTPEELREKLNKRAALIAQEDIRTFKQTVNTALSTLLGASSKYEDRAACLAAVDDREKHWPSSIWRKREQYVMNEVLATMDAMQKTLSCKGPDPDGPQPAEEDKSDADGKTGS